MDTPALIEAILFYKNEPITLADLARMLKASETEIKSAAEELRSRLTGHGLILLETGNTLSLGTAPGASETITALTKEELSKDLGKAGLETLAIVAYYGPISRSEIDYIRGVNSSFILRNLLVRGLVEREVSAKDSRIMLYQASIELLAHLGLPKIEDLPEFEQARQELASFTQEKGDSKTDTTSPAQ